MRDASVVARTPAAHLVFASALKKDASGESTVSRGAAMCASLIRTNLIVNRPRKENLHAESSSDSGENTTLSHRSHLDHDRSSVADVICDQVDRRCPAAQQLRARREGGAGVQGPHDSDDRCREELLRTDL